MLQRRESRVAALAQRLGPRTFIRLLRLGQSFLNVVTPLRAQGNKFFCAVTKRDLQPWIELRDGRFQMKRPLA